MNYGMIRTIVSKIMLLIAILMLLPLLVSLIYDEGLTLAVSFIIPIALLTLASYLLSIKKPKIKKISAREGFIIVGLSWLVMSGFGCLPFIISKEIPNFFDAFFEITSGFTTTGASVVSDVEALSHSIMFWRSFSHWIGGMGILVFILALIPESTEGSSMHILRAESPGPQVGKLVSKMKVTSRILYLIYLFLTIVEMLLLWLGPDKQMDFFHSLIYSLGTAGTGGFAINQYSLEYFSHYSQYVIAIFMIIFAINFTIYYLLLVRNWKEAISNEEVKVFLLIVITSTVLISINIYQVYNNVSDSFRLALFQVASIISTTGYSTANFDTWPETSKIILVCLTVFGACAGSTAGGIKISRVIILFKSSLRKIKAMINPRKVECVKVNGKPIDDDTIEGVQSFTVIYLILLITCALIISLDGFDLTTNITASLTCISNVGPGLNMVGPYGSFSHFSNLSKLVLSFEMIAGRLEIFPILILFYPKTWRSRI